MNLERIRTQVAVAVERGTAAAMTDEDLSYEWSEAVALYAEKVEIDRLHGEVIGERQLARTKRRLMRR